MMMGNQWPSEQFDTTNSQASFYVNPSGGLNEKDSCMEKQFALPYFTNQDTEVAAQLYYEAALIVVGPDHKMQHPKPSEELYLSKKQQKTS